MKETTPPISPWKKWGKLVVISLALAIIIIDTTLLNVSLRNIVEDLNTNFTDIQWVITIYTLTLSALTITGGRLGDLYGRKRMFMLGAILFALGSFVASISHSIGILLIGESIIEGVGAALMMPAAASLLLTNYTGKDRAIAFSIFGAIAGGASAVGPLLGGWLTSAYSWRWGFRINIFVVVILLIGSVLIKDSRDTAEKKQLDFGGVILSAAGLLALAFGIIQSSDYGWWRAIKTFSIGSTELNLFGLSITPISIFVGIILLIGFGWWQVRREANGQTPLVSLHLFESRQFVSGALVTAAVSLALTGLIFVFPIYFQAVHNLDAFHTGLALFPLSLSLFIASPAALIIAKKVRPKYMIIAGLTLTSLGVASMIWLLQPGASRNVLVLGFILFGTGMGLVQSQINNLTLSAIDVQFAGEASGVSNTLRQVGSSFGAAIIGAALFTNIAASITAQIKADPAIPDSARAKITEQAKQASKSGGFDSQPATTAPDPAFLEQISVLPPPAQALAVQRYQQQQITIGSAVGSDVKDGITNAARDTLWVALAFTALSIVVGFGLPNIKPLIHDTPVKPNPSH